MKTLRHVVLLLAAAMFLAACGTSTPDDPDNGDGNGGDPETGSIVVTVVDDNSGDSLEGEITLADSEGNELDTVTDDSVTFSDLEAGTYSVTVTADGYLDLPDQALTVAAGETTTYTARMEPAGDDGDVSGSVANVEIVGFTDVDGNAYDNWDEANLNKEAKLVAAQTEEMVGVTVRVTDADGNPVTDAPVTINALGFADLSVAVYPGQPNQPGALRAAETSSFDGLRTDDDGEAHFIVEAVYGAGGTGFGSVLDLLSGFEGNKFIVSAIGSDNIAQRAEFKAAFINMSHLYVGEVLTDDVPEDEDPELTPTEQRMGNDLGTILNIWNTSTDNVHDVNTFTYAKQPQEGPFPVGFLPSGLVVVFEDGERTIEFGENGLSEPPAGIEGQVAGAGVAFGGFMQYELTGGDLDSVSWETDSGEPGACDYTNADGTICVDSDASGVSLVPNSDVALEDLPIEVDVDATFVVVAAYGEEELYTFDLKDYSFTKRWVGGFLSIDKHVDNHVLTWSGPDVTLGAQDVQTDSPWTSTVHVDVTNDSGSDIYNVTVRDALPPELGIDEASISNGGTYDAVNHVVTWDFNSTPDLQDIAVGETVEVSFDVYARQKPGYCWDGEGDANYNVQPNEEGDCYADPYLSTNGEANQSVTAAGFFEPENTSGSQPVFSYSPDEDESDIWVVRPLFQIAKERTSQATMREGASASYDLTVTHVDRSDETGDAYYDLAQMYPWEFGDDTEGTGHRADGYEFRNNTYAQGLEVTDAWEVGLDFTNGTPFSTEDGTVGSIDTTNAGSDKIVSWSIGELDVGATATAELVLTGNLLSDDGDGGAVNFSNSDYGPSDPMENNTVFVGEDEFNAWNNCLYLDATQLNQPDLEGEDPPVTWYDTPAPWSQNQITSDSDAEWLQSSATSPADFSFGGAVGDLAPQVCAPVAVMPPPDEPFMNISTNGESDGAAATADQNEDVAVDGETYYYRFTAQNVGDVDTDDVAITITGEVDDPNTGAPSDGALTFLDTVELVLYRSDGNGPWMDTGLDATVTGDTVMFDSVATLGPDDRLRVVLPAEADAGGELFVEAQLTYSNVNEGSQTNPIGPVFERTDVQ